MGELEVMGVLRVLIAMIRPAAGAILLLFAALGLATQGRGDGIHPLFTTVLITIGCWFVNATVLNDLADEAIDRVNLANVGGRPLVSGDATRRHLAVLGAVAGIVALVTAWMVGPRVGVVVSAGLVLNAAYSLPPLRLSGRGTLTLALLPLGYVVLPFLVGVYSVGGSPDGRDIALLGGLYVVFMGRMALKDFRDLAGDARYGKRTFLVRHGPRMTCIFSAACWLAGSATIPAIVPDGSFLILVITAYIACALHGLSLLAGTEDRDAQQTIIGAIAHIGRATAITLLAQLTMVTKGWTSGRQNLVFAAMALAFVGMYLTNVHARKSVTAPVAVEHEMT